MPARPAPVAHERHPAFGLLALAGLAGGLAVWLTGRWRHRASSHETRRLEAEAAAQREQTFSNAMIDAMPGIVYFYDEQGRFLRWNQNFARVSGYDAAEIATMHPLDFFAGPDKPRLAEKIAEVYEEGESSVEATFVSKDGRTTPYFFTGRRVMLDDVPCLIGVGMDITARRKAQQALEDYARRLQATSRRLLEVQETERRILARDLHDSVGQELTALSLNLSIIGSLLPAQLAPSIVSRLEDSQKLLEATTQHLRHVMIELRPPGLDELGLLAALKDHAQRVAARSGLGLRLQGREPRPRFPDTIEIALFRIAQEALNNAVKHAGATEIAIALVEDPGQVSLVVEDNGRGMACTPASDDATAHGMGMTTMRERAEAIGASLRVDSRTGQGTCITVKLAHPHRHPSAAAAHTT